MTIAAGFGTGQVVWSLLWLALFVLVAWTFITVFIDIVRSDDLTGWAMAGWTLLLLILPLFGAVVYLIVRGSSMNRRLADAGLRAPIEPVGGSRENERFRLRALLAAGEINEADFEQALARLGDDPEPTETR